MFSGEKYLPRPQPPRPPASGVFGTPHSRVAPGYHSLQDSCFIDKGHPRGIIVKGNLIFSPINADPEAEDLLDALGKNTGPQAPEATAVQGKNPKNIKYLYVKVFTRLHWEHEKNRAGMSGSGNELGFRDDNCSGVWSEFFHAIGQSACAPTISKIAVDRFKL